MYLVHNIKRINITKKANAIRHFDGDSKTDHYKAKQKWLARQRNTGARVERPNDSTHQTLITDYGPSQPYIPQHFRDLSMIWSRWYWRKGGHLLISMLPTLKHHWSNGKVLPESYQAYDPVR